MIPSTGETMPTPAVEDAVNQVISYILAVAYLAVALLAFPQMLVTILDLLHHDTHRVLCISSYLLSNNSGWRQQNITAAG